MSHKVIFITGASSGFGEAIARLFACSGWRLILNARRQDRLVALSGELERDFGSRVHLLAADIRDRDLIASRLENLPDEFSEIDVLVNNAGLALGLEPAHQASTDDWHTMIDTNVTALVDVTRMILPGMVERNRGHIVNMGSVAGTWPYPSGNVYGATKAFVRQFGNNLLSDLSGTAVRVSTIEPGLSETEFSMVRFHGDSDKADQVYKGTSPLTGSDIADIVHWVVNCPPHVNINAVEVMPVCQSFGAFAISRRES